MLNKAVIMGRLTKDPELRHTQTTQKAVASFTLAVQRDTKEKQTDFIDCVAWNGTAEFVSKYFQKGSAMVLLGRLQVRNWEDPNGNKRRAMEVVADSVYFGDSKKTDKLDNLVSGFDIVEDEETDPDELPF